MFCPKCGNRLDMFAEKCLSCGTSFKGMSMAERQRLELKPRIRRKEPKGIKSYSKIEPSSIRRIYDKGILVCEGLKISIKDKNEDLRD